MSVEYDFDNATNILTARPRGTVILGHSKFDRQVSNGLLESRSLLQKSDNSQFLLELRASQYSCVFMLIGFKENN